MDDISGNIDFMYLLKIIEIPITSIAYDFEKYTF